jgi:hypothetical protein
MVTVILCHCTDRCAYARLGRTGVVAVPGDAAHEPSLTLFQKDIFRRVPTPYMNLVSNAEPRTDEIDKYKS